MEQRVMVDDDRALRPRKGKFGRREIPSAESFRNRELVEVVDALGRPVSAKNLGLGGMVAHWKFRRTWIEIVFDEHHRAERISIT
jgi:hypothetical protein